MKLTLGNLRVPAVPPPPGTYATWNPSDKGSNITLSGGDLIATHTAGGSTDGLRGTNGKSSGKWYYEITLGVATQSYIGAANATASLSGIFGASDSNAITYYANLGSIYNGAIIATLATYAAGDTIRVAVDVDAGLYWTSKTSAGWNGGAGDPAAGTGGYSIASLGTPVYIGATMFSNGTTLTLNAGASAFIGTVPAGFSAWTT